MAIYRMSGLDTFSNTDLTKFFMCSVYLNIGTFNGKTHMMMIFSFLHLTGNAFCSYDNSVMQLIHILIHNVLYKPLKIQGVTSGEKEGQGMGPPLHIQ
jgi:hypothetical protein